MLTRRDLLTSSTTRTTTWCGRTKWSC